LNTSTRIWVELLVLGFITGNAFYYGSWVILRVQGYITGSGFSCGFWVFLRVLGFRAGSGMGGKTSAEKRNDITRVVVVSCIFWVLFRVLGIQRKILMSGFWAEL
jgi:hypothetical protein